MNRYSRTVTQPKDQGASQVSHLSQVRNAGETDIRRPCCTLPKVSKIRRTFKRPWSVSLVYGEC